MRILAVMLALLIVGCSSSPPLPAVTKTVIQTCPPIKPSIPIPDIPELKSTNFPPHGQVTTASDMYNHILDLEDIINTLKEIISLWNSSYDKCIDIKQM